MLVSKGLETKKRISRVMKDKTLQLRVRLVISNPYSRSVKMVERFFVALGMFVSSDFFRANFSLFRHRLSNITSANPAPTKEKVASRKKNSLVENRL